MGATDPSAGSEMSLSKPSNPPSTMESTDHTQPTQQTERTDTSSSTHEQNEDSPADVADLTAILPDLASLTIYGQEAPPVETPQFLSQSQAHLLSQLEKLNGNNPELMRGWNMAKEKAAEKGFPELVDEGHLLMFLRCELFNAEMAALRLAKYWNRRIELFGDNLAFQPLKLSGDGCLSTHSTNTSTSNASNDGSSDLTDQEQIIVDSTLRGLSLGLLQPTQTHDNAQRGLLFVDPSKLAKYKHNETDRMGVARAFWYVLHSMLCDPTQGSMTQRVGIIVIGYPHHVKLSYLDRKLMKMNMESLSGCLPIRVGALHVCHPPWFFGKVAFPIMKMVMSERMRKRVRVHVGSVDKVLGVLDGFGLGKEVLPKDIGGELELDFEGWLEEKKVDG